MSGKNNPYTNNVHRIKLPLLKPPIDFATFVERPCWKKGCMLLKQFSYDFDEYEAWNQKITDNCNGNVFIISKWGYC